MGKIHPPCPVKPVCGILAATPSLAEEAEKALEAAWGGIDLKSELIQFDFTSYYEKEMGKNLWRRWVSFKDLSDPGTLAGRKKASNDMEKNLSSGGYRRVNLDPGYLSMAKLVLASTKDFSHRIFLSDGIYAEVTLIYRHDAFSALPWTYPDYQSETALKFLLKVRETYHSQLSLIAPGSKTP